MWGDSSPEGRWRGCRSLRTSRQTCHFTLTRRPGPRLALDLGMKPLPRPRALVIDDERYVRELVCEVLCWIGCDVDAADNGIQGLALFERGGYDVVLTDASM